ncbi:MAG: hypothetical protein JJU00_11210 [Opitutales bacterium]|nr:hypothetical protein [Opitutales bacterium]
MPDLRPIYSPWRYRLREFRRRYLPLAVFCVSLGTTGVLWDLEFSRQHPFGEDPSKATIIKEARQPGDTGSNVSGSKVLLTVIENS